MYQEPIIVLCCRALSALLTLQFILLLIGQWVVFKLSLILACFHKIRN